MNNNLLTVLADFDRVITVESFILKTELEKHQISYDGPWPGGQLCCFTDRDPQSPSFGASFDLETSAVSLAAILAALSAKREQFEIAFWRTDQNGSSGDQESQFSA